MMTFINEHRHAYGVEPICRVLPVAPSTYYTHAARQADPEQQPDRWWRDETLCVEIRRVWDENKQVYGVRKVWKQLCREGYLVARCTVARLMKQLGLRGVVRGKVVKSTHSDKAVPCPHDQVNRQFHADRPNALWVSDFTYVSTWAGFVYVAFVIDVYARRIVNWKVSSSARTDFVLDALEQALHDCRPTQGGLIQHSERRAVRVYPLHRAAGRSRHRTIGGQRGDSYDNALAETINGLYKAEVIHRQSLRNLQDVELATLEWVDWFNHKRLLGSIGDIPPAEAEANYYRQTRELAMAA